MQKILNRAQNKGISIRMQNESCLEFGLALRARLGFAIGVRVGFRRLGFYLDF